MEFMAYVWAICKNCGHHIKQFTVKERDFPTWKIIQLKKNLYCRRCRGNVKIDIERAAS